MLHTYNNNRRENLDTQQQHVCNNMWCNLEEKYAKVRRLGSDPNSSKDQGHGRWSYCRGYRCCCIFCSSEVVPASCTPLNHQVHSHTLYIMGYYQSEKQPDKNQENLRKMSSAEINAGTAVNAAINEESQPESFISNEQHYSSPDFPVGGDLSKRSNVENSLSIMDDNDSCSSGFSSEVTSPRTESGRLEHAVSNADCHSKKPHSVSSTSVSSVDDGLELDSASERNATPHSAQEAQDAEHKLSGACDTKKGKTHMQKKEALCPAGATKKAVSEREPELPEGCISVADFSYLKRVGKGAFGDVFLVRKKTGQDAGRNYALKMIYKCKVADDEYLTVHFRSEKEALQRVRAGPFLSTLYYAFQSPEHLFLIMDYNSGGQLLQQFIGKNVLLENHMRVYLAELVLAVDFLHIREIIHRDIKPENVLLDRQGHVVLIDFGLSKLVTGVPNESHVGTEPYIAPEILQHRPHDRMADFWSLGVLGYEMVAGSPPWSLDLSDEKLRKAVLEREPQFNSRLFHKPCKALLQGLMQKNPKQRLGAYNKNDTGGIRDIKGHKFFKCLKWNMVAERKMKPPSVPPLEDLNQYLPKPFTEPKDKGFRRYFPDYQFSWLDETENTGSS
ncbi:Protein kinase domain [Trinorchestia longiramus]|nr:Protein kinase domain [Trinorchestia longiramus]